MVLGQILEEGEDSETDRRRSEEVKSTPPDEQPGRGRADCQHPHLPPCQKSSEIPIEEAVNDTTSQGEEDNEGVVHDIDDFHYVQCLHHYSCIPICPALQQPEKAANDMESQGEEDIEGVPKPSKSPAPQQPPTPGPEDQGVTRRVLETEEDTAPGEDVYAVNDMMSHGEEDNCWVTTPKLCLASQQPQALRTGEGPQQGSASCSRESEVMKVEVMTKMDDMDCEMNERAENEKNDGGVKMNDLMGKMRKAAKESDKTFREKQSKKERIKEESKSRKREN